LDICQKKEKNLAGCTYFKSRMAALLTGGEGAAPGNHAGYGDVGYGYDRERSGRRQWRSEHAHLMEELPKKIKRT
jgi:hypothetical protein